MVRVSDWNCAYDYARDMLGYDDDEAMLFADIRVGADRPGEGWPDWPTILDERQADE